MEFLVFRFSLKKRGVSDARRTEGYTDDTKGIGWVRKSVWVGKRFRSSQKLRREFHIKG